MSGPFKMKGSPMLRNFGIGASPMKQEGYVARKLREGVTKLATWHKKTEAKAKEMYKKPKARGVNR